MHPYRLRPPSYGAKLRQQKQKSSLERTHPYREGGPLERAIKADLTALYNANFEQELFDAVHEGQDGDDNFAHMPKGTAFGAFKQLFSGAKVAMLHRKSSTLATTGFLPPRCDRNAYSQLLYAVCLSLLRDAFKLSISASETLLLNQAAYAIFNLYALYKTNPLPRQVTPKTAQEWLALLPMGLQNRDNPSMIFRRAFSPPIRIDIEHYGYLLQLRNLAQAAQARCHQKQCAAVPARSGDEDDNKAAVESTTWTCECAVATDLVEVLDRILSSSNMLELSAYTGPCGLEGLAGHADYPFPAMQAASTTASTAGAASSSIMQHAHSESVSASRTEESYSSELEEHVAAYLTSRQAIRLPAMQSNMSQRDKRIRETLMPIFLQDDEHGNPKRDLLSTLLASCRGEEGDDTEPPQKRIKLRHRHVTFGTVIVNEADGGIVVDTPSRESKGGRSGSGESSLTGDPDATVSPTADTPAPLVLILPSGLTSEQRGSLQDAALTLLDRDDSLLLPRSKKTPSNVEGLTNDGVSTLGDDFVSTVGDSTVADTGRDALRELLSRVKVPISIAGETTDTRSAGQFFLSTNAARKHEISLPIGKDVDTHLSDLSSDEENDEVSVAASRVGRRALEKLLSSAGRKRSRARTAKETASATLKRKTSDKTILPHKGRHTLEAVEGTFASQEEEAENRSGDSDDHSESSSAVSSVEAEQQGRNALNALLSRVHHNNGRNMST